jgi:hypothetical protein
MANRNVNLEAYMVRTKDTVWKSKKQMAAVKFDSPVPRRPEQSRCQSRPEQSRCQSRTISFCNDNDKSTSNSIMEAYNKIGVNLVQTKVLLDKVT